MRRRPSVVSPAERRISNRMHDTNRMMADLFPRTTYQEVRLPSEPNAEAQIAVGICYNEDRTDYHEWVEYSTTRANALTFLRKAIKRSARNRSIA